MAPGNSIRERACRRSGCDVSWDELVAAALIGTDRRPVPASAPPGSPPELTAALEERSVEDRLLAAAPAGMAARPAGPPPVPPVGGDSAADDPRPLCPPLA